jgi:endonuclease/exonuclease/phosphatase (EEP) superfamily protein YafD
MIGTALYLPRLVFAAPLPLLVAALALTRQHAPFWAPTLVSPLLLLVLLGFVPPSPRAPVAGSDRLRILSYNVDSAKAGADEILAEIQRFSPDVVLLEEMASPEPIAGALGSRYATVELSGQFLLATNLRVSPVIEPPKVEYEGRLRSPRFVRYVLETPIGRVALYQVHPISPRESLNDVRGHGLRWEVLSGRVFSSAHEAVFRANSELRELQVRTFTEAAAREVDPVIIAGDTNLPALSWVLNRYLARYADGFVKGSWGFGYTFPRKHGPWMRIDRILAGPELCFTGFEVGTSLASDHRCVVADLARCAR